MVSDVNLHPYSPVKLNMASNPLAEGEFEEVEGAAAAAAAAGEPPAKKDLWGAVRAVQVEHIRLTLGCKASDSNPLKVHPFQSSGFR